MEISSSLGVDYADVYCIMNVSAYAVWVYVKLQRNKEKKLENRRVLSLLASCSLR
jgi:hypothetical protein